MSLSPAQLAEVLYQTVKIELEAEYKGNGVFQIEVRLVTKDEKRVLAEDSTSISVGEIGSNE